jgi:Family of unknown function (DUF6504)
MSRGEATSSDRPGGNAGAGDEPRDGAGAAGRRSHAGRPGPHGAAAPIAVRWDERQRRPVTFVWRRRRYRVERVLEAWVLETGWWKDAGRVSRSYWRVRAEGRVFDLRYDRLAKAWALERVLN